MHCLGPVLRNDHTVTSTTVVVGASGRAAVEVQRLGVGPASRRPRSRRAPAVGGRRDDVGGRDQAAAAAASSVCETDVERAKRKSRERRATLVLGVVMPSLSPVPRQQIDRQQRLRYDPVRVEWEDIKPPRVKIRCHAVFRRMLAAVFRRLPRLAADRTAGSRPRVRRHLLARLLQLGAESNHLYRLQSRLSPRLPETFVLLAETRLQEARTTLA